MVAREFEMRPITGGAVSPLRLELSTPRWNEAEDEWVCQITLSADNFEDKGQAFGVDSLQALLLALQMADAKMEYLKRTRGISITWNGEESTLNSQIL